jgi:hypothetical protein
MQRRQAPRVRGVRICAVGNQLTDFVEIIFHRRVVKRGPSSFIHHVTSHLVHKWIMAEVRSSI